MMRNAIENFAKQFGWEPRVEKAERLGRHQKFLVAGMGGSHLGAGLLKIWKQELDIVIHRDYGLPPDSHSRFVIASSYSGNTEETIDAFEEAERRGLARAALSVGGKLIRLAQEAGVPYIQMPDTGIQPRSALGFSTKGLLKLMGEEAALKEISVLRDSLDSLAYEAEGQKLAEKLKGYVPLIYTSSRNAAIGLNWKIKFNETAKIPAFYNVFPELNHNEMTGFDAVDSTRGLSDRFFFIFLRDSADHPKIRRRMEITAQLYRNRGLAVEVLELEESGGIFYKIFSNLILADWAAYYTAEEYGVDPEQVPMVEEFKGLIKK